MDKRKETMAKRLRDLISYYSTLDMSSMNEEQREKEGEKMYRQICIMQHERLIHLIVTVLFAIITFLVFFYALEAMSYSMVALLFALLLLLIPYIRHYYILENGVQKLYTYYDEITGHNNKM
jgi:hypothetical protein